MQDTCYYATRKRTYLEIAKAILSYLVWLLPVFLLRDVREAHFFVRFIMKYSVGFIVFSVMASFSYLHTAYDSLYHPVVRIEDKFLITNFDRAVWPWDYIENAKIIGSTIRLTIKKRRWPWNKNSESLSFVPKRKELVRTLIAQCEQRGIPCETQYLDQL
ncbi:MAG: hypothetical protein HXS40_05820 [Theionarchaea archaeon]|nr:hypothetical protein [Theionarchaea archaeon]